MNPQDLLQMISDLISGNRAPDPGMARSPQNFQFAPGSEPDTSYYPRSQPSAGMGAAPADFEPSSAGSSMPSMERPRQETLEDWRMSEETGRGVFSDTTLNLGRQFGYTSPNEILSYLPSFRQIASEQGNSAEFQRELYRQITGQEPPENYTGFHASQAERIGNVFSPDEADINVMKEIAFIATAMRELTNSGFGPWGGGPAQPQYRQGPITPPPSRGFYGPGGGVR